MNKSTLLLCAFAALMTVACNNKTESTEATGTEENRINPEIVNNPATANGTTDSSKLPAFDFAEGSFDFGTLRTGASVTHEFRFKNVGKSDLLITQAKGSCGCTQPEYPKDPIAPDGEGVIKVTFNSTGISGQVAKTVTVLANTIPNTKVLTISGEVVK
jgi:hypothetical protein